MRLDSTEKFDVHAAPARSIHVEPPAAAMGAEIKGAFIPEMSDEAFAEVEEALLRHKMIFVRNQELSHGSTTASACASEDAYTRGVPGHDNVQPVIKEAADQSRIEFGSRWHTDSPFLPKPSAITTRRSVEVPLISGDTIWANPPLVYASLSEIYQQMIEGLRVRFFMRDVMRTAHDAVDRRDTPMGRLAAIDAAEPPEQPQGRGSVHPMVRTHRVTGEQALDLDGTYAIAIEGMSDESAARPRLPAELRGPA